MLLDVSRSGMVLPSRAPHLSYYKRMRSYLSDTYSKARHYLALGDKFARIGQVLYRAGTPMLAYGMDAYGATDETKMKAYMVKQALDATGKGYNKLRRTARAIDTVAGN